MMSQSNQHRWLLEPLESDPGLICRPMFGCLAAYYRGRLVLVLADKGEPWSGVLIPVERSEHGSLQADFENLEPHPILPKWLYLSESDDAFESVAQAIVARIQAGDARFGVEPKPKKSKRAKDV